MKAEVEEHQPPKDILVGLETQNVQWRWIWTSLLLDGAVWRQESEGLVHHLQHDFFFFLLSFHLPDSCRSPAAIIILDIWLESSSSQWVLVLVLVLTHLHLQQDMKTSISLSSLLLVLLFQRLFKQLDMFSRVISPSPVLKDRMSFFLKILPDVLDFQMHSC